jgi:hypothetical protein
LAAAQGNEQAKKSLDVLRPAVATAPEAAPQQQPPAAITLPPAATAPVPSTQPSTISSGHKLIISKTDCKQWLGTMPNSSRLTFSIENQTTNNYSELVGKYIIKDAKNKLIKQGLFVPGRIRPQSVAGYELTDGDMSCNEMASFEITSISPITAIDGVVVRISGDDKGTEKITDDILRGITVNWKTSQPVASSTPATNNTNRTQTQPSATPSQTDNLIYTIAFGCSDPTSGLDFGLAKLLLTALLRNDYQNYAMLWTTSQIPRLCMKGGAPTKLDPTDEVTSLGSRDGIEFLLVRANTTSTLGVMAKPASTR